jgi:hypothetical protein
VAAEQQQQQQGMTAWMPETMGADMNFASHKSRTVICSAARCEILLAASAWKRRVNEAILSSAGSQSTSSRAEKIVFLRIRRSVLFKKVHVTRVDVPSRFSFLP